MQVKIALIQEAVRKLSKCLGTSHLEEDSRTSVFMQVFLLLQSFLLGVKEAASLLSRTLIFVTFVTITLPYTLLNLTLKKKVRNINDKFTASCRTNNLYFPSMFQTPKMNFKNLLGQQVFKTPQFRSISMFFKFVHLLSY